ncbi:MAG: site-2 protease family protein [Thermoplasmata archaeon]|nr:MAG: site-2 protease family protein [Thermoplasmata archaeon]
MRGDDNRGVTYRVSYQPYEIYYEPPGGGGLKFSDEEKKHLIMAIGALTLAFTVFWTQMSIFSMDPVVLLFVVGIAFVAVLTGFLLHELGHKIIAQKYGCWAEFRAWPMGLMLAVISAFIGFLFAAPGAVYIRGNISKEENGKISAAGPGMNIVVASFLLPVLIFIYGPDTLIGSLIWMICYLNVFLGGFNMIPFPPLDGSKIIRWNPVIWIGIIVVLGSYFILLLTMF